MPNVYDEDGNVVGFVTENYEEPEVYYKPAPPEERPRGSSRFHELLKIIGDLHDKKQADYGRPGDPFANIRGSNDWGIPAWKGAMVRANDKIKRIQSYAQNGKLENEGVADSFMDLAVYSLIALILHEEEQNEKKV